MMSNGFQAYVFVRVCLPELCVCVCVYMRVGFCVCVFLVSKCACMHESVRVCVCCISVLHMNYVRMRDRVCVVSWFHVPVVHCSILAPHLAAPLRHIIMTSVRGFAVFGIVRCINKG